MTTIGLKNNKGFIALMSAIIISAILLIIAVNTSLTGYYNRFNILNSEIKEMSSSIADACLDVAILNFALDSSYSGNENIPVNLNSCYIGPVTTNSTQKIFNIKGIYKNAHTNLKVTVDGLNFFVISVEEILTF